MKNYSKTAEMIIEKLGGEANISTLTHCMTRLRFTLHNDQNVNDEEVKKIPNVMGVVRKGSQYQVIIGNDVSLCYQEVQKRIHLNENKEGKTGKKKFTLKSWGMNVLDAISAIIAPLIPVILGCGMVKILIIVLDLFGVSSDLPIYQLLVIIGDAGYYFLPILVAFSASKKFKCSTPLAVTIVAVLIHPSLIALIAEESSSFLGIPVTSASYSSTVIPAMLSVWFLSKAEPIADKLFTSWRRTLLKPLAILLVCTPVTLIILAPFGMLIGNGMAAVLSFCYTKVGWLTIGVYAAVLPFVVMAGMHVAVFPYIFSNLDTLGYDFLQLPAMLGYNFSQAAAALAVSVKSKDKDMKATAFAAAISAAVGGITEPALYGVNLKLRKPLVASMIGSGLSGLFIGIVGVKAFAFSGPCLLSFPMFASTEYAKNFLFACIAAAISIIVTFVLTLVFGWEEDTSKETEVKKVEAQKEIQEEAQKEFEVLSPIAGKVISLKEVKDETFAQGILGKGIAVIPEDGRVVAPFDGKVVTIFPTKHAIGLEDESGRIQVLIHIGMDTVELNGEGFTSFVEEGSVIKKGDALITFEMDKIKEKGYDITTPIIIPNSDEFTQFETDVDTRVNALEAVMMLK
ncbi:MAG: beta-glucoside-specific PTS transporter subunit IIABC [Faecalicatena sp.]|uniref:beta-glucoside-specific PTS transporter subunit IIABC n=1 Tax=Faecalicatena sp. TaxID=2005360 RepID=UPI002590272C|nr:beta-glucoside-specific PTS transporter subunit IIABC [Faecalicatena sp.]MCI6464631.1 beta-glucoside-specific PTS transporter subunit IIABC [Faecalicatena sp.]MDY5618208.1 beta-glucoside-specific PTS transporter subunit IIABC [Lachnospiraceae bacterium]